MKMPLVVLLLCLCPWGGPAARAAEQDERPRAFLQHLPGVGGTRTIDQAMVRGLGQAGLHAELVIDDWTRGDPGLPALAGYERNRAEAKRIAERLVERARREPDRPIFLTGHSGGGGMTIWTLEQLPEDVTVEAVLLLAPALSPEYDLSPALRRVRGNVYVFHSIHDWILGRGTRAFGTLDGVRTDAAGRVGFVTPESADQQQYAKLIQYPYDEQWTRYGNFGEHIGMMTSAFAREFLAPLLIEEGMPVQPKHSPPQSAAPQGQPRGR